MTPRFFPRAAAFRHWLKTNHDRIAELWVGFHKKETGKPSITYPEAVDEALCFGWIDGLRHSVDEGAYMVRFTPRRARSIWSAVNLRRFEALRKEGLVEPPGVTAFARRDPARTQLYSFENNERGLEAAHEKKLRANREDHQREEGRDTAEATADADRLLRGREDDSAADAQEVISEGRASS